MTEHEQWFYAAGKVAERARCRRAKCGAVIVKDGIIIGEGYNAPPLDEEGNARCDRKHELSPTFKSDKTCCVHAEWRAVFNALRSLPGEIVGSTLYFTRVDEQGRLLPSGDPYCTICSKIVLDVGITYFALWHENGIRVYEAHSYNDISFASSP
jgi:deoxycytidylate deaminase